MAAALDRCVRSTSSGLKAAHRQYGLIGNGNAGQTSKSPLLANHRKIKNADQDQSPSSVHGSRLRTIFVMSGALNDGLRPPASGTDYGDRFTDRQHDLGCHKPIRLR
jgi:hypothetical protein